jgi:hypothetical protein
MIMNKAHSPADTTRILKGKTWLFGVIIMFNLDYLAGTIYFSSLPMLTI